jgi:hypothetical protein
MHELLPLWGAGVVASASRRPSCVFPLNHQSTVLRWKLELEAEEARQSVNLQVSARARSLFFSYECQPLLPEVLFVLLTFPGAARQTQVKSD